jgi:hypothetical protein
MPRFSSIGWRSPVSQQALGDDGLGRTIAVVVPSPAIARLGRGLFEHLRTHVLAVFQLDLPQYHPS